jgi:hypothetical protein
VASIFPSFDAGSPTFSLMSCRGHDNTHVLSGFKRLSMAQAIDKLDTVMEVPLDMNLGKGLHYLLCCCTAALLFAVLVSTAACCTAVCLR